MGTQEPHHTPREEGPQPQDQEGGAWRAPPVTPRAQADGRLGDPWFFISGSTRLLSSKGPSLPRGSLCPNPLLPAAPQGSSTEWGARLQGRAD